MSLRFTYSLCGAGWAEALICIGENSRVIAVSYIHDSLFELTSAINQILNCEKDSEVVYFLDEPGEHKLMLRVHGSSNLSLELFFSEGWSVLNDSQSLTDTFIMSTITRKDHFAQLVLGILENILEQYGEQGYKKLWINHSFPLEQYQKLKLKLSL